MAKLFIYGTLAQEDVLLRIIGRVCKLSAARLTGYKKLIGKWPYLVADAFSVTSGWILDDLSDDDMAKLDAYEEVATRLYERKPVEVRRDDHPEICWVYLPLLETWQPEWLESAGRNG